MGNMNQFQEKLKLTIEEIKQLSDRIISNKDISRIEIDILLSKLRDTYSLCLSVDNREEGTELVEVFELEKEEKKEEKEEKKEEKEEIEEKIEIDEIEKEELKNEEIVEKEIGIEEEPVEQEALEQEIIEEKKTPSVLKYLNENMPKGIGFRVGSQEKPPNRNEVIQETIVSIHNEVEILKTTTLGEKFQNQGSLFESINRPAESKDINNKLNKSRADLRTAIGVHEKFMFINDLFAGNLREYTEFIQNLNNAESLDDAKEIIKEIKEKKRWVISSLAYTTLENVVERKFSK